MSYSSPSPFSNAATLGAFRPFAAVNHVQDFYTSVTSDGCKYGCNRDRTDASGLPWCPDRDYGGWGGADFFETPEGMEHTPVVFVHGNQRDACDWTKQAGYFLANGYRGDELWAITFGEATPTHDEMAVQLDEFVAHVRRHTGAGQVVIVGHSLGVTGARYWLSQRERFKWVKKFIGLAGANHGMDLAAMCCRFGFDKGPYRASEFLRSDHRNLDGHPLTELNEDETPGDVEYYTLRGSRDKLFLGNRRSPILDGAEENRVIGVGHDGVRESDEALELVYQWAAED